MKLDGKQKKRTTHLKVWRKYDQLSVKLEPYILRIVDCTERIIWINSCPAPDANVIGLRQ